MGEQPQVVVRGEAVLTVPPEAADVVATVRATARDRETALERCRAGLDAVAAVVARARDALERAETGSVSVHEQWQEKGPPLPTAVVETRLVLSRLEAAGDLVVALGRLDDVGVSGPFWRLRAGSRAPEDARLAAIDDAVRRARLYAGAFGAEITGLLEIADAGLTRSGRAGFAQDVAGVAALEKAGPGLELTPEEQRVHGSVEVRFSMSVPDPEVFRR